MLHEMITQRLALSVVGMTCDGCAQTVAEGLKREDGVHEADVSFEAGSAVVAYDPQLIDEARILKSRIFRRQYQAEPQPSPSCC
jgi:mercuric reductase